MADHYIENLNVGNLKSKNGVFTDTIEELTPGAGVTINSNLVVNGTVTKLDSIDVVLKDAYVYLNSGNLSIADVTGGIIINRSIIDNNINITSFIGNVLTVDSLPAFAAGDFVETNGNLYEVDSQVGLTVTLRTLPVQDFSQKIMDLSLSNPAIRNINLGVMRVGVSGIWETGYDNNADTFTFAPLAGGATLQSAYDGGFLITKNASPVTLKGTGTVLDCVDLASTSYFSVSDTETIVAGKLTVGGLIDPTGLQLTPVLANPGNAQTFWIDNLGKPLLGTDYLLRGTSPVTNNGLLKYDSTSGDTVATTNLTVVGNDLSGIDTLTANSLSLNSFTTDTINEKTPLAGVTIEGVLAKNNTLYTDTIEEKTLNSGVNVAGVSAKNGVLSTDTISEKTLNSGVTIDGLLIKDGGADFGAGVFTMSSHTANYLMVANDGPNTFVTSITCYKIGSIAFMTLSELIILVDNLTNVTALTTSGVPAAYRPTSNISIFGTFQRFNGEITNTFRLDINSDGTLVFNPPEKYKDGAGDESGNLKHTYTYSLN